MTAADLAHVHVAELRPTAPFDFDATVHKPDHFPTTDVVWEPGRLWQSMVWQGQRLGLVLQNAGGLNDPAIFLHVYAEGKLDKPFVDSIRREVEFRFNLALDLQDFYALAGADPQLEPVLSRRRGLRPINGGSLYEYLIIAIVLQNATVRRSVSMMQALFERYGSRVRFDGRELSCFWQPSALALAPEEELRGLKVGYRAKSLNRVSQPFASGQLDEMTLRQARVDEQKGALLALYGIGPASVGYIMTDVFHRWGFLEHISPWEQKIYTNALFGGDYRQAVVPVSEMLESFERRFGRYKALAVHYLWEDLWWQRHHEHISWLEELIRL
jgi:3-methyladenine DNA glycosylase/8-oxoguanine DNA glycosylase